jgi:hypothetical protein
MTQTIITAGDASAGLVQAAGNDGTLVLQAGPAGSKVNALSFAADGTPTLLKQPVLPVQSMVRLNTDNGFGSTNTKIRRFTNITTTQGADISYVDSATLGASFTVNTSGVYGISFTGNPSAVGYIGISLNTVNPTTVVNSLPVGEVLAATYMSAANGFANVSWQGFLPAGSVIRAHTDGISSGAQPAGQQFTITRVA